MKPKETTKRLDPQAKKVILALGRRLRELRYERGWTLEDCEDRGFKNWRHLQEIESGKNITIETLVKVARIYKVNLAELLRGL
ncbi:helix-turn-helix domain-containing protein [Bdellovibrionota bacterium FG-2]